MTMDYDNWRRAVTFASPRFVPYWVHLHKANWMRYGDALEQAVLAHPLTWPEYRKGDWKALAAKPWEKKENPEQDYVDSWGCVWRTTQYGFVGTIVHHPLADEAALAAFTPPDEATYNGGQDPEDFAAAARALAAARARGLRPHGGLAHGYFLLRLEYLRGFEKFMCDLLDPSDAFRRLFDTVHGLNRTAVGHWIAAGAGTIGLPEDLGAQDRSIIGPRLFRRWALPCYKELHGMAQRAGCLTTFHTDGYIMDIADLLLEIGPSVLNPQDSVNGVEKLAEAFKGRLCINLDIDRQHTLPFGSPADVRDLIEYEIKTLGTPRGGLTMMAEVRSDVPPDNVEALAGALEKFSGYRSAF